MITQTALRAAPAVGTADRFATDVLAGLSAKPKQLPPKYFYDSGRLGSVRTHHAAAGILSDALRACICCRTMRRRSPRCFRRAAPCSNSAQARARRRAFCSARRPRWRPTFRSIFPAISCSRTPRSCAAIFRGSRVHPVIADFTSRFRGAAAACAPAAGRLLSRIDHRQFRAPRGRANFCVMSARCSARAPCW